MAIWPVSRVCPQGTANPPLHGTTMLSFFLKQDQEALSRLMVQEQELQQVQQQLREEMASKVRGGSSLPCKPGPFGAWWPKAVSL